MKSARRRWWRSLFFGSGIAASLSLGTAAISQELKVFPVNPPGAPPLSVARWVNTADPFKHINPMLGIRTRQLDDTLKQQLNISEGAIVEGVVGKNAEMLHPHDIIVSLNGKGVADPRALLEMMHSLEPGDVELGIVRQGKPQTIKAQGHKLQPNELSQLAAMPSHAHPADRIEAIQTLLKTRAATPSATVAPATKYILGIELSPDPLSEDLKGTLGIEHGAVVRKSREGSPAEKAGIQPWDVITQMNDKSIAGLESLREALSASEGKEVEVTVVRKSGEVKLRLTPEKIATTASDAQDADPVILSFGEAFAFPGQALGVANPAAQLPNDTSVEIAKGADNKTTITVHTIDKDGNKVTKTVNADAEGIAQLPAEVRPLITPMLGSGAAVDAFVQSKIEASKLPQIAIPYTGIQPTPEGYGTFRITPSPAGPLRVFVRTPDGKVTTAPAPNPVPSTEQAIAELNHHAARTEKQLSEIEKLLKEIQSQLQKGTGEAK